MIDQALFCFLHKEVNNNINRGMKKAKENWIGEQRSEIEENLRKNNSKRVYQLVKDWPLWNKEKLQLSKIVQETALQKNESHWTDVQNTALSCTITRLMEIHQYWTVPRHTHRGWPPCPSQRSEGSSTILEEREVSWIRHPSRTGPSRWKDVLTALTTICDKMWQTGEWPTPWTQSLVITTPEKGNLQQCRTTEQ